MLQPSKHQAMRKCTNAGQKRMPAVPGWVFNAVNGMTFVHK